MHALSCRTPHFCNSVQPSLVISLIHSFQKCTNLYDLFRPTPRRTTSQSKNHSRPLRLGLRLPRLTQFERDRVRGALSGILAGLEVPKGVTRRCCKSLPSALVLNKGVVCLRSTTSSDHRRRGPRRSHTTPNLVTMSAYIPLFNNRSASRHQSAASGPDFGAFDDPSDGEEDAHAVPSMHTSRTSLPRGSRALGGGSSDDSLSRSSQQSRRGSGAGGRVSPQAVPGAYDFEPQANEGGPPPSIQHRTRPSQAARASPPHSPPSTTRAAWNPLTLTERFLPATVYSRLVAAPVDRESSARLLFSQDEEDTDVEGTSRPTYPPHGTASLIPLPPRPLPGPQSTRVFGGGQGNDGVFANLSAKPDGMRRGEGEYVGGDDSGSGDKDEVPPVSLAVPGATDLRTDPCSQSYEAAALDSTPPYWETTIITPQGLLGPDDICVDGMPVGNLFSFAWSLLVSMSFQFVGTYPHLSTKP